MTKFNRLIIHILFIDLIEFGARRVTITKVVCVNRPAKYISVYIFISFHFTAARSDYNDKTSERKI